MATGLAWRERRRNGDEEFRVRCSGIRNTTGESRIPGGAGIEVLLDGEVVGVAELRNGSVELRRSSRKGEPVPAVDEGTTVTLRYEGVTLFRGTFERD